MIDFKLENQMVNNIYRWQPLYRCRDNLCVVDQSIAEFSSFSTRESAHWTLSHIHISCDIIIDDYTDTYCSIKLDLYMKTIQHKT